MVFHARPSATVAILISLFCGAQVHAQDAPASPASQHDAAPGGRVEGTVVSVRRASFMLRTSTGQSRVFALGSARPAQPLRPGLRVAVMTVRDDPSGAPRVLAVAIRP
jgi:hypothetical protein